MSQRAKLPVAPIVGGFPPGRAENHQQKEIFACVDRGVVRWLYRWDGANGAGHVRGVDVMRVRDGKVADKFSYVKG